VILGTPQNFVPMAINGPRWVCCSGLASALPALRGSAVAVGMLIKNAIGSVEEIDLQKRKRLKPRCMPSSQRQASAGCVPVVLAAVTTFWDGAAAGDIVLFRNGVTIHRGGLAFLLLAELNAVCAMYHT